MRLNNVVWKSAVHKKGNTFGEQTTLEPTSQLGASVLRYPDGCHR
jgi:hypothetical protein